MKPSLNTQKKVVLDVSENKNLLLLPGFEPQIVHPVAQSVYQLGYFNAFVFATTVFFSLYYVLEPNYKVVQI